MKHQAYSTYSSVVWKHLRKDKATSPESLACSRLQEMYIGDVELNLEATLKEHPEAPVMDTKKALIIGVGLQYQCFFLWYFRKLQHFFLAPGVADLCEDSVKKLHPDCLKRLPVCSRERKPSGIIWAESPEMRTAPDMPGAMAIHFPVKERAKSIIVMPCDNPSKYNWEFFVEDGLHYTYFPHFEEPERDIDIFYRPESAKLLKLVCGLSLYMDAFPETVVPAGNDDVQHIRHYEGSRHVVSKNEIFDEERRNSVSPHWRRGHWHLLQSERFVHKKGQTIYIRGTFVKGKAFDVLDDTKQETPSDGK